MPIGLAVITEASIAALSLTADLRTGGAASGHHCEAAVGSWTPASVRVSSQHSPQHQRLVEVEQLRVLTHQHLYIIGVEDLTALGTLEVDAALLYLYPHVLLQTHDAGEMRTVPQVGKLVSSDLVQTQRTLSHTITNIGPQRSSRRTLHTRGCAVVVSCSGHPAPLALIVSIVEHTSASHHHQTVSGVAALPRLLLGLRSGEGWREKRIGVEESSQGES